MRRLVPFVAVLVLAPTAAWLVFTFGLRGQVPQAADAIKSLREEGAYGLVKPGSDGAAGGGDDAAADDARRSVRGSSGEVASDDSRTGGSDSGDATDSAAVDRTVSVTVLDGSEDGGGEDVARRLRSSGYRQVNESTYSADEPVDSTVYVRSVEYSDTASDVARVVSAQAGGSARSARVEVVVSEDAASSAPIVVVVR